MSQTVPRVKKKRNRTIYNKLKKKFQLSIFNESTLESVFTLRISLLDGILLAISSIVVLVFISFLLIRYTPVGNFMPAHMDVNVRKQMVMNAYKVDSLGETIQKQSAYIDVIKAILAGEIPMDSTQTEGRPIPLDTLSDRHLSLMKATRKEQTFREQYEENEKFNLSTLNTQSDKKVLYFYTPVKGEIIGTFDPRNRQNGIDVRVNDRQPVLSVLSGTVIYAGYNPDFRYVIQVQHADDYISIYKYNSELLKKAGDVVKAGEALAIVGKTAGSSEPPHVYIELWQKGVPQNPVENFFFQ